MWTLVALGAGQFVSIVGSRISAVALGLWVFQSTGSVTRFALVMALAMVPTLGLLPITGALADRLDRRRLVLAAELGLAVSMAVVAALALGGQLEVWHVYVNSVVHAVLVSFLLPSYAPLVAGLVPPERLTRANAIVSTGQLGGLSLAPLVAGLLVARIPLGTLLVLDVASYVGPILAVLLLRTPPASAPAPRGPFRAELTGGWQAARSAGLLPLMAFFAAGVFWQQLALLLVTPLVLSLGTPSDLGMVLVVQGVGMVAGGVLTAVTGGPRHRIRGLLVGTGVAALCYLVAGVRPDLLLVSIGLAGLGLLVSPMFSTYFAILASRVAADRRGRVFALDQMLFLSAQAATAVLAGPLVGLTGLVATGPGRDIGLLFVIGGLVMAVLVITVWRGASLRRVELVEPRV